MSSHNFDDLPDDPEQAFVELALRYETELDEFMQSADERTNSEHFYMKFINRILAAASACEIPEFENRELPPSGRVYDEIGPFRLDLERYVLRWRIRNARVEKRLSVSLDTSEKASIHRLIAKIRKTIEESDLDERKRNTLYDKLNEFAAEVDKSRTGFGRLMYSLVDISDAFSATRGTFQPIADFTLNILTVLKGAKDKESSARPASLPKPEPRRQIEPPKPASRRSTPMPAQDDDEIPF